MKTQQQKPVVENLDAARRGTDRARLPIRTANIPLPANGETQRRIRPRAHRDSAPAIEAPDAREPFGASDLAGPANDTADGARWPGIALRPRERVAELEKIIEEQRSELSARHRQIADLHNVQQQQSAALLVARDAIECLERSVADLQETAAQQEKEAAAAKQKLQLSVQEKNALSKTLADKEKELVDLLQKLLHLSTDLNDREVAIDSAEERVAALMQELAAKAAQEPVQVAPPAIEEDEKRHRDEADEPSVQFESQLKRLESMLAAGDEQINRLREANTKPPESHDGLDQSSAQFESRIRELESTLAARDQQIDKLTESNTELSERCDTLGQSSAQFESQIKTLESTLAARDQQISRLRRTNTESPSFEMLGKSSGQFESQIRKLEITLATRDQHITNLKETNSKLSERCDELTQNKIILESAHKLAQEKLESQAHSIKSLETALRTTQDSTERKIAELTVDLHREREANSVAERETATIRKEIALLLPKLAMTARSVS